MFGVALALPAAYNGWNEDATTGLHALIWGWSGTGIIAELANVALLVGWVGYMVRMNTLAFIASISGLALSLTAPLVFSVSFPDLRVGFFLWVATILLFTIAAGGELLREIRAPGRVEDTE